MKIVADAHIPFVKDYFNEYGELILKPGRAISPQDVKDADILLVRSITRVDEGLLENSALKFVGSVTAGADHLDIKALDSAGITWSVANGFNAPPVADYVVSTIAALQRRKLLLNDGLKAAVIGVGNVGQLVVERLKLLNFAVTLCDPFREQTEENFLSTSLEDLADFDLITLHVPLTRAKPHPTYHFINQAFLSRQKPNCILLNASRGAVINSAELKQFGTHLKWCFDVWEHEPKIDQEILMHTLTATPHIAGYSVQSKIRGIDMIYRKACEQNIIKPQAIPPIVMPAQRLAFAGANHHWQDLVLGIFNPLIMTAMMRTTLYQQADYGSLFDEMRNRFNYRHEFTSTEISGVKLLLEDEKMITKLGIKLTD